MIEELNLAAALITITDKIAVNGGVLRQCAERLLATSSVPVERLEKRLKTCFEGAIALIGRDGRTPVQPHEQVAWSVVRALAIRTDEALMERFQQMLAVAMTEDSRDQVHPRFAVILAEVTPIEIAILDEAAGDASEPINPRLMQKCDLAEALPDLQQSVLHASLSNLEGLGLLAYCVTMSGLADRGEASRPAFTDFGALFMHVTTRHPLAQSI